MRFTLKYFTLCLIVVVCGSCKRLDITLNNPNDKLRPAAEFVHNNFEFSLFYAAIQRAGLVDELNNKDRSITVFAPGNSAFNEIGIKTLADINRMDIDSLRYLVRLHVLNQALYLEDLPQASLDNKYISAAGTDLWLSRNLRGMAVNGAFSTQNKTNIRLSNGVFHEIDKVLKYQPVTIQKGLETESNYSILVAGLKKFGLWEQLALHNEWTIMAPDNAVFEKQGITQADIEGLNASRYGKRLFGAYIFAVRFFTTDLEFYPRKGSGADEGDYSQAYASIRLPITSDAGYSHGINNSVYYPPRTCEFFAIESLPLDKTTPIRVIDFNAYPSQSDFVYKNGIVHRINELIFSPEETLIK